VPDNTQSNLEERALLELDQQSGAAPALEGSDGGDLRQFVSVSWTTLRRQVARLRARWNAPLVVGITGALLAVAAWEAWVLANSLTRPDVTVGMDFRLYLGRAQAWLGGEGFYLPLQLAGPYPVNAATSPTLYPPVLLYLLVPFTVLPAVLWWAIPFGIIATAIRHIRPGPWSWPVLALILVYPRTWVAITYGNPSLWALAAIAAGLAWSWPMAFAFIKPTLAAIALVRIRRPGFWRGLAVALALSIPLLPLWIQFASALLNARNGYGLDYLLGELPIALALVFALRRGRVAQPQPRRPVWRSDPQPATAPISS
jgi:hypothetical protein